MKVVVDDQGQRRGRGEIAPTEEMLSQMGAYNENTVKAGIMLDGQGRHRVQGRPGGLRGRRDLGRRRPVHRVQGDRRGLLGLAGQHPRGGGRVGQALPDRSAVRRPPGPGSPPVFTDEDFGAEYTDELRERDAQLAEEIKSQHA